jgi:DNA-binding transcriptional LysR family regulator
MTMNLEHYRNFITIVDCGNLTAAAEELHIAQPALTAQVKNYAGKIRRHFAAY